MISLENLILAWKKARKGKTKRLYAIEFERDLENNLLKLNFELKNKSYIPRKLTRFILRDPKTRVISKADFRDRIIHHAIVNILEPIYERVFVSDSCANRKGKGTLYAIKRFEHFRNKVSRNGKFKGWFNDNQIKGYCLKADIKHYFQEVNHEILLKIISRKIKDENVMWLINQIVRANFSPVEREREITSWISGKGMPLGNLTSQFFANIYLNELDYFVKHDLKAKYYIRYVDDFVILHQSKEQLKLWKNEIDKFLYDKLKLELHPDKSKIIFLSRGVDFLGFRNFYHFKLLRKRNIRKMIAKVKKFEKLELSNKEIMESFSGWNAYAKWGNTLKLRRSISKQIYFTNKKIKSSHKK